MTKKTSLIVLALIAVSFLSYNTVQAKTVRVKVDGVKNSEKLVDADNAQDVLKEYKTEIVHYSFGDYVKCVEGKCAAGSKGWIYMVNCKTPPIAADQYKLDSDDYVIWFYKDWNGNEEKCDKSDSNIKKTSKIKKDYDKLKKQKKSLFAKSKNYYKNAYKKYLKTNDAKWYNSYVVYSGYLKDKLAYAENPKSIATAGSLFKSYLNYNEYLTVKENLVNTIKGIKIKQ
jgi:hypothetical protein